ncbi:MAG: PAS domain S-box protein, partial [Thiomicrorhabdus sp.]|nr:PAS domain S-box protein [Thiomicrorhabdus sp.]
LLRGELVGMPTETVYGLAADALNASAVAGIFAAKQRPAFEAELNQMLGSEDFTIWVKNANSIVKQQANEQYLVIKYAFPFERNRGQIGLDAYAIETQKQAMLLAQTKKEPISSVQQNIEANANESWSVRVYQPVYDNHHQLKGFVSIVLNMSRYMNFVRKHYLLEESLGLFISNPKLSKLPVVMSGKEYLVEEALYRSKEFSLPFAGRNWLLNTEVNLKFLPDYQVISEKKLQKFWLAGILMSLILMAAVYLFLQFRYQAFSNQQYIRNQEKRYKEIIDQSSEAYYLLSCNGQILDVNSETCRLLGYERAELLQKNINQIDSKYQAQEIADICKDFETDTKILFETIHQRKDGVKLPVEVNATKFKVDGEFVVCAFTRDLSERMANLNLSVNNEVLQQSLEHYTKQLNDQKKAFETIFEKSADGIFISEGRHVLDCNQATVDMFGYKSKEQILSLPNRVFAPKFQPDGESSHRKGNRMLMICLEKGSHHYEWVNRRANGENFWTDVVLTRLEYYGRTVVHIAFRDISKRKKLEEEMRTVREEAVAASQAKSEFLAKMSHDIRTPLHGILSYAQMGQSRISNLTEDKLKRYFENIQLSGERLMGLLNDLLDSAKLESGLMQFDFQYQSIEPIIERCLLEQRLILEKKGVKVVLKYIDFMAYFDSHRIAQVVSNLLSNAIRYSPMNSSIVISVDTINGEWLVFSIQDSGKGVKENELETIFNQFVQSEDKTQNSEGSGLGLTICKEIIQAHNGRIWAENWLSKHRVQGANFRFTLPIKVELLTAGNLQNKSLNGEDNVT